MHQEKHIRYVLVNPEGFYFKGNGGWVTSLLDAKFYETQENALDQIKYWMLDYNCKILEIKITTKERKYV
jgi:hypothetical protein